MAKLDDWSASRSFDDTKVRLLPTDKSPNEFLTVTIVGRAPLVGRSSVALSLFSRCELNGVPLGSSSGRNGTWPDVLLSRAPTPDGIGLGTGVRSSRENWLVGV